MDTEKNDTIMRRLVSAIDAKRGGYFVFRGIKQQLLCILDDAILPPVGEISAGGIMGLKTHTII